jgi:hypothetical protein
MSRYLRRAVTVTAAASLLGGVLAGPALATIDGKAGQRCVQEVARSKEVNAVTNPRTKTFVGGTDGDDFRYYSIGTDEVFCGFAGDDGTTFNYGTFFGGAGNDHVEFNLGRFFGGDVDATVYGGAGDDEVARNEGTFHGGSGNDRVFSNYGTFYGGDGDDVVVLNFGTCYDAEATFGDGCLHSR